VERLCGRAVLLQDGHVAFEGGVHETLARYRRQLAEAGDGDGRRQRGEGEAAVVAARLVDPSGSACAQVLAGEPLALEVTVAATPALPAPRLRLELRDDAGLLVAEEEADLAALGWPGDGADLQLRLDVASPPLEFGRFRAGLLLLPADGGAPLHALDDAAVFVVYPDGEGRGLVRLGGTWSGGAKEAPR
jgi:hypothetical protein